MPLNSRSSEPADLQTVDGDNLPHQQTVVFRTIEAVIAPAVPVKADWKSNGDVSPMEMTAEGEITPQLDIPLDAGVEHEPIPQRWLRELASRVPQTSSRWQEAMREMPKVGAQFLDFFLEEEIGRGAFGRVFVARQGDMAGRRVALKVSVDLGGEINTLSQLQHTNIMPIYSAHRTKYLQAVCMPYFSRTTLGDLCQSLQVLGAVPESGQFVVSTLRSLHANSTKSPGSNSSKASTPFASSVSSSTPLDSHGNPLPAASPLFDGELPNVNISGHSSYVDSILWMIARLAEGLAHAHDRWILHRDLKPANILLTPDGMPLLLDFNLAEDMKQRDSHALKMAGTVPYMSPEQMEIFGHLKPNGQINNRSDIYSLGLIFYQLLTGRMAFAIPKGSLKHTLPQMLLERKAGSPNPRPFNPAITPAVAAILSKCMHPNPDERYSSAHALAEDIERHRANLPLKHTKEPSYIERGKKWCRRHPLIASPASVLAFTAAIGLSATAFGVHLSLERKQAEIVQTQNDAIAMEERFEAKRQMAEQYLSCQTENTRWRESGIEHGLAALDEVAVLKDPNWQNSKYIQALPPERREQLKVHIGELSFMLARAAYDNPARRDTAEELHQLAGQTLPANDRPLVDWQQASFKNENTAKTDRLTELQQLLKSTGLNERREQFLLATELQSVGSYRDSKKILQQLSIEQPDDAGVWFMLGRAHQMLGESLDALQAYGRCITLKPKFAPGYYNRATLADSMQNWTLARTDVEMAIRLEPKLHNARILRAIVLIRQNQRQDALAELTQLMQQADAPVRTWFLRANLLEANGDAVGAKADRDHGLAMPCSDAESYVARGVARMRTEPKAALGDFAMATKLNPHAIEPWQNMAHLHGEVFKQPELAIVMIDELLKRHPDYLPGVCSKGVYLARLGKHADAIAAAERSLKLSDSPFAWYRAACVYAIVAKSKPEHTQTANRLIAKSLQAGYGHQYLPWDHDLDPIRTTPEFTKLVDYSRLLAALVSPASVGKGKD